MENLLKVKKDFLEGYLRISDLYQKNKQFDKAIFTLNQILNLNEKKDHHRFDGPSKFIKELEKNPSYNLINLFNFGILPNKPSSSGITVINKK